MVRCIEIVFERLPPKRDQIPTREERLDANIGLQAFVFNVFGSIDNLAWIWVSEKGMDLDKYWIGLGPGNRAVRKSLSDGFQHQLKELDSWFNHLEDFRHSLAHRIPLYIPPYVIAPEKEHSYREIEGRVQAAATDGKLDEYYTLLREQERLGEFRPVMLHSPAESSGYVHFYPQLFADFNTVKSLGDQMLHELRDINK